MNKLQTAYMGVELKNPIIAGSSNLNTDLGNLKKIEEAGAAAIVYKSLFEEQIHIENLQMDDGLEAYNDRFAEMHRIFPNMEHAGPAQFLMDLEKAVKTVKIPVFGSLNAAYPETWAEWAPRLEKTGIAGIELNFYAIPREFETSTRDIIDQQITALESVLKVVKIPVAVKISHNYTNPLGFMKRLVDSGASGLVLFNRLFHPDIDIATEKHHYPYNLSSPDDNRLPLRFSGLLYNRLNASICASTGIYDGKDVIKMLLAGADTVQVVSTLYKNGIEHISTLIKDLDAWMTDKNYQNIDEFRGKLSYHKTNDPFIYKRAQYVDILMKSGDVLKKRPLV